MMLYNNLNKGYIGYIPANRIEYCYIFDECELKEYKITFQEYQQMFGPSSDSVWWNTSFYNIFRYDSFSNYKIARDHILSTRKLKQDIEKEAMEEYIKRGYYNENGFNNASQYAAFLSEYKKERGIFEF